MFPDRAAGNLRRGFGLVFRAVYEKRGLASCVHTLCAPRVFGELLWEYNRRFAR